jgi:hypothetical protein
VIHYPFHPEHETLLQAIIHAGMMAGAEAQGGAKNVGYVIVCRKCGELLGPKCACWRPKK